MRYIKNRILKPICWNLLQQPWVYDLFTPRYTNKTKEFHTTVYK